jgi:LPXTG-motif cell wall-anchored protein
VYHVQAYLRYRGGIAHLNSFVRFGHAAAVTQQNYGGPKVRSPTSSGISTSLLTLIGGLFALCLALLAVLLVRRRREGRRPPLRMLDAALAASRERGEPLSLITVTLPAGTKSVRRLVALVRSRLRLRKSDRMCRLHGGGLFVLAADTDRETAEALAADMRRQFERVDPGARGVTIEVHCPEDEATAADLLQRMSQPDARELVASG